MVAQSSATSYLPVKFARSLQGTGVTANCLHPGFVATRFVDESGGLISRMAWLAKFFAKSPAEGAQVSSDHAVGACATTVWERSAVLAGVKE
jgi:NAD(P)-dependent dehydrogenase (short-subunit alcohol dehydrogenase family)